jgi:serine/threonine protein kinase
MKICNPSSPTRTGRSHQLFGQVVPIKLQKAFLTCMRKKIMHRDIKPGNVLVIKSNTEAPIFKITDFGLSRMFDDSYSLSDVTDCGTQDTKLQKLVISSLL